MRLWHEELIPLLPRQQLLGQHRECCAMRGNGWGKKHRVVDYVFKHSLHDLELYHAKVMQEMFNRGYKVSSEWFYRNYRGKHINTVPNDLILLIKEKVYLEHDEVPGKPTMMSLEKVMPGTVLRAYSMSSRYCSMV